MTTTTTTTTRTLWVLLLVGAGRLSTEAYLPAGRWSARTPSALGGASYADAYAAAVAGVSAAPPSSTTAAALTTATTVTPPYPAPVLRVEETPSEQSPLVRFYRDVMKGSYSLAAAEEADKAASRQARHGHASLTPDNMFWQDTIDSFSPTTAALAGTEIRGDAPPALAPLLPPQARKLALPPPTVVPGTLQGRTPPASGHQPDFNQWHAAGKMLPPNASPPARQQVTFRSMAKPTAPATPVARQVPYQPPVAVATPPPVSHQVPYEPLHPVVATAPPVSRHVPYEPPAAVATAPPRSSQVPYEAPAAAVSIPPVSTRVPYEPPVQDVETLPVSRQVPYEPPVPSVSTPPPSRQVPYQPPVAAVSTPPPSRQVPYQPPVESTPPRTASHQVHYQTMAPPPAVPPPPSTTVHYQTMAHPVETPPPMARQVPYQPPATAVSTLPVDQQISFQTMDRPTLPPPAVSPKVPYQPPAPLPPPAVTSQRMPYSPPPPLPAAPKPTARQIPFQAMSHPPSSPAQQGRPLAFKAMGMPAAGPILRHQGYHGADNMHWQSASDELLETPPSSTRLGPASTSATTSATIPYHRDPTAPVMGRPQHTSMPDNLHWQMTRDTFYDGSTSLPGNKPLLQLPFRDRRPTVEAPSMYQMQAPAWSYPRVSAYLENPPAYVAQQQAETQPQVISADYASLAASWATRNKNSDATLGVGQAAPASAAVATTKAPEAPPRVISADVALLAAEWAMRNKDVENIAAAKVVVPPAPVTPVVAASWDVEEEEPKATYLPMDDLAREWAVRNKDTDSVVASTPVSSYSSMVTNAPVAPPVAAPPAPAPVAATPPSPATTGMDSLAKDWANMSGTQSDPNNRPLNFPSPPPAAAAPVAATPPPASTGMDSLAKDWAKMSGTQSDPNNRPLNFPSQAAVSTPAPAAPTSTTNVDETTMDNLATEWASMNIDLEDRNLAGFYQPGVPDEAAAVDANSIQGELLPPKPVRPAFLDTLGRVVDAEYERS